MVLRFRKDVSARQPRTLAVSQGIVDAYLNNARMVRHHIALGDGKAALAGAPSCELRFHILEIMARSVRITTPIPTLKEFGKNLGMSKSRQDSLIRLVKGDKESGQLADRHRDSIRSSPMFQEKHGKSELKKER